MKESKKCPYKDDRHTHKPQTCSENHRLRKPSWLMDCGQGTPGYCWIKARSSRLPSNWSIPHGEHVPFDALCATQPAGSTNKIMLRWSLLPPWAPTERGRTRVDLGKARALVTISVRQQSCAQWLNQEIFGRNERPRASARNAF